MKEITGGVTAAQGFQAACCEANIKYKNRTDMAMVYSQVPCECAGTFTSNVVKAACVQWDQKIVSSGAKMQAVVVNSGIANACTGKEGFDACEATAKAVESSLLVPFDSVAVAFVPGNYAYAAKLDLAKAIGKESVAEPIKLVIAVQDHRVNGVGKFLKEAVLDPDFKKGVDSDPVFKNFAMPKWWNE